MSLTQLHLVIIIRTINSFWIPNPSLLSASCTSGLPVFSCILFFHVPSYAVFTSALLDLLYSTVRWSRRRLLEGFCFALLVHQSPMCWLPRKLKSFGIHYLGNYYRKLHSAGGGVTAFRCRVTLLSQTA
jgi:hypothetical protein